MIREGSIKIPYRYAAGAAGSRFLSALRDEGRILASRCSACGRVLCPARSFCPVCAEQAGDWIEVGPQGRVVSWTEVSSRLVYGLVRLDGADTALAHRMLGEVSGWTVGARVRARFAAERTGSILDIEGFERVEEGQL